MVSDFLHCGHGFADIEVLVEKEPVQQPEQVEPAGEGVASISSSIPTTISMKIPELLAALWAIRTKALRQAPRAKAIDTLGGYKIDLVSCDPIPEVMSYAFHGLRDLLLRDASVAVTAHVDELQKASVTLAKHTADLDMTEILASSPIDDKKALQMTESKEASELHDTALQWVALKHTADELSALPKAFDVLHEAVNSEEGALKDLTKAIKGMQHVMNEQKKCSGLVARTLGNITSIQATYRAVEPPPTRAQLCQKCLYLLGRTDFMTADDQLLKALVNLSNQETPSRRLTKKSTNT